MGVIRVLDVVVVPIEQVKTGTPERPPSVEIEVMQVPGGAAAIRRAGSARIGPSVLGSNMICFRSSSFPAHRAAATIHVKIAA
jgi:hypothetical protein